MRKFFFQSMYQRPLCPPFKVSGGPLAAPMTMGWHITNERGLTTGVSCDSEFKEFVEQAQAGTTAMLEHRGNVIRELQAKLAIAEEFLRGGCPHACRRDDAHPCPFHRAAALTLAKMKAPVALNA